MTLSAEDARALAYQQQQRRRATYKHNQHVRLHGNPAARLALLRAWEPIIHAGEPYYPGQYTDFPAAPGVPPMSGT